MRPSLLACLGASQGPKLLNIWALAPPSSGGSVLPRSAWGGGWSMTALTSIPGSMSIRVEGGP